MLAGLKGDTFEHYYENNFFILARSSAHFQYILKKLNSSIHKIWFNRSWSEKKIGIFNAFFM